MINPIRFLFVLGFCVVLLTFLGIPVEIKFWIYSALGIAICINAYVIKGYYRLLRRHIKELQTPEEYGTH